MEIYGDIWNDMEWYGMIWNDMEVKKEYPCILRGKEYTMDISWGFQKEVGM